MNNILILMTISMISMISSMSYAKEPLFTLKCWYLDDEYKTSKIAYFTLVVNESDDGNYLASIFPIGVSDFDDVGNKDNLKVSVNFDDEDDVTSVEIPSVNFKDHKGKRLRLDVALYPVANDVKIPNYAEKIPFSIYLFNSRSRYLQNKRYLEMTDEKRVVSHVLRFDEKGKPIPEQTSPYMCVKL